MPVASDWLAGCAAVVEVVFCPGAIVEQWTRATSIIAVVIQ